MPMSAKARDPRGVEINFDEATHRYWSVLTEKVPILSKAAIRAGSSPFPSFLPGFGEEKPQEPQPEQQQTMDVNVVVNYVSGTRFVNHFFPPFDPDGRIAEATARKRGISVEQLKFEWKQNSAAACEYGTRVHETAEDTFYRREYRNSPRDQREMAVFTHARNTAMYIMEHFNVMGVEQIVFDIQYQLAGSIDLLAQSKKDGVIWIFDHKTNKKIDRTSRYGTKGLYPIEHIDDCEFNHYALQLSTYEMILRTARYIPHGAPVRRAIFHYTEAGAEFMELPDFSLEVREMAMVMLEEPPF